MAARVDPQRATHFSVEIDGVNQASFNECTIPDTSSDPIEYRNGDDSSTVRKIPGLIKYSNIVLKWGITDSMDIYNWYKEAILDGKYNSSRKNVSVILMNEINEEVDRWDFVNCWPTKYDAPDLKAAGSEIAIETLEIAHEGMARSK